MIRALSIAGERNSFCELMPKRFFTLKFILMLVSGRRMKFILKRLLTNSQKSCIFVLRGERDEKVQRVVKRKEDRRKEMQLPDDLRDVRSRVQKEREVVMEMTKKQKDVLLGALYSNDVFCYSLKTKAAWIKKVLKVFPDVGITDHDAAEWWDKNGCAFYKKGA